MKTETKMRNPVWYSILTTLILFINPSSTTITLAFKSVHNLQIKQRLSTNVVTLRPASTRFSVGNPNERENDEYENESLRPSLSSSISRRRFIPVATTVTTGIILTSSSHSAQALYEVDRKSGELFSSKNQMLGRGGSDAARGVSLTQRQSQATAVSDKKLFSSREPIQDLYNTRFITYLARFLLTFDPPSRAWWIENVPSGKSKQDKESTFASFAESVEVGLADYFLGPYGSYASVQAAKAGISAAAPANSFQTKQSNSPTKEKEKKKIEGKKYVKERRQGIINLLALLQARYTAKEEKLQLAILFSFITDPALQPTKQITALLGESDNASIESIEIVKDKYMTVDKKNYKESKIEEVKRNMELNTHGGYSINQIPKITISPPPALGKDYKCAIAKPIMRQTSRILKIRVTDGGSGYKSAPTVTVSTGKKTNDFQPCHAAAILGRDGEVDEIIVLNPGFGYADEGITVQISPPSSKNSKKKKTFMTATASAELEYEISRIDLINGGNGYVSSAFPEISISIEPPADDPDWVLPDSKLPLTEQFTQARVTQTRDSTNTVIDVKNGDYSNKDEITENKWRTILADLKRDPTKVLPNSLRPQLRPASDSLLTSSVTSTTAIAATITSQQNMLYTVPLFTSIPDNSKFYNKLQFSPLFRDVDPIFGGLGIAPVTKRAMTLGVNEYTRLALSGAICTVLVRTLLNPLELVKTKIQLKNDLELLEFASQKAIKTGPRTKEVLHNRLKPDNPMADTNVTESSSLVQTLEKTEIIHKDKNTPKAATTESSTFGTISSMIELRGPQSLFQSADVTFLASLVFGSLGFGATELFRRSFTLSFFEGGDGESELIILLAAAVATIVTSFAASPFEMMRVRSMGLVEPKAFGEVLGEFLVSLDKFKSSSPCSFMCKKGL